MANLNLCVRGFSDAFTDQFSYLDFPEACEDSVKISLTHDPAGAFDAAVTGLVLAGHTHCGQIRLPFIGPLYVPSTAPSSAHCGLYEDDQRQVFVSSGVGTSVLPIRFLAQAQWDLITIKYIAFKTTILSHIWVYLLSHKVQQSLSYCPQSKGHIFA